MAEPGSGGGGGVGAVRPGSQGGDVKPAAVHKYGADGLLARGREVRPGSRGTHVNLSAEVALAKFL
eukprot:SAG31_NODE_27834_length_419_cov_1.121875_1_plen_66_part_00